MKGEVRFKLIFSSTLFFITLCYILIFFSVFTIINFKVFKEAIFDPGVLFSIKLSVVTAVSVTVFSLIFGVPSAYALSRLKLPLKGLVDLILDVPIALSPVAMGAMFLLFFNTPPGAWIEKNLVKFVFEIPGIILVQTAIVLPFSIRIMKSHFDTIPESYELVSRSLGYSRFRSFFHVTLPLSRNALLATVLTAFSKALGEFGATVTLVGAIPMKTQTLPVSIYMALSTAGLEKTFVLILVLVCISILNLVIIRFMIGKGTPV